MPKITWVEQFSVGHLEIDRQHQKWIAIFNSAHDRMIKDMAVEDLSMVKTVAIGEMLEYAQQHFAYEEAFMQEIGYPELDAHILIHRDFESRLKRLRAEMESQVMVLNSEIIKLIENWLVQHILGDDQAYAAFLKK